MNVILLEPTELDGDRAELVDGRARHALDVLGVAVGDRVRVGVIDGALGTAEVISIEAGRVLLKVTTGRVPERPRVDLVLALPRPKVLGRLYSVLAQLGIGRLMLTNAERVERYYFDAHQLAPDYRRAQLIEGLAQARDTRVPEVSVHKSLRALMEDELDSLCPQRARLLADPGEHPRIAEACAASDADRVVLAIGPEGGWNDFERALFASRGFSPVSMGARTLRTDVAITSALALLHDALSQRR